MKTPTKLKADEFFMIEQSFLAANYSAGEAAHGLICKHCKSRITMEPVMVPLHEAELDRCVETGNVQFMRLPYCPRCENPPNADGCIHVSSLAVFLEWCALYKEVSELLLIMERRHGRRESGIGRRRIRREYFEGDVTPETHHAFARPDIHEVLTEFGYWINDFDGDFSTYVRRGGKDYIQTHRLDGSWRHIIPGEVEAEDEGSESLRRHLHKRGTS